MIRLRALVGLTLPDGDKSVRVEAGKLIPPRLLPVIPESWFGTKVEEA
jgi:hypothetical protein